MSASTSAPSSPERARCDSLALALAPRVGAATYRALVKEHGSASEALTALHSESAARTLREDAAQVLASASVRGIAAVAAGEPRYPDVLEVLPDAPPVLWALGDLSLLDLPMVAIVGTRRCTAYGERIARDLATAFARRGVCVISGLARGIDAAAHSACLDAGGRTIAILGTGVDIPYPSAHRALHARVAREGLLLAEPLPGRGPVPGCFPRRNRLIAAIAPALIVVEAGVRSGALITARIALDLGRTIGAVPGPIDSSQSAGSNLLLRDGAIVIAEIADALALCGVSPMHVASTTPREPDSLAVWEALADGPLDADTLCARSRLPVARCMTALSLLEVSGHVECALTGEIRRR